MMKFALFGEVLFFIALSVAGNTPRNWEDWKKDMDEEKMTSMFMCIDTIACTYKDVATIKRMMHEAGPGLQEKMRTWHAECFNMKSAEEEPFYADFVNDLCPCNEKKKKVCIREMIMNCENYMEVICTQEQDLYECDCAKNALKKLLLTIEEHTVTGKCSDPKDLAKAMTEEGAKRGIDFKKFG